jgi:ketosteroid isomerase-like protein
MSEADRIAALERRIDALESREAITALIYRYTEAIRHGRPADILEMMAEDAVVELHHANPDDPDASELVTRFAGHDEIRHSFANQAGPGARIWPMIHNLRIDLDGDRASSICVLESAVWPVGKQFVGEYRDTWARHDGIWKITARRHIGFGDTAGVYSREAYVTYRAAMQEAAQT